MKACEIGENYIWNEENSSCILKSYNIDSSGSVIVSTLQEDPTRPPTECCSIGAEENDDDLIEACGEKFGYNWDKESRECSFHVFFIDGNG